MKEEQNINIKIAGLTPIAMTIPRDEEEAIRVAERNVNRLWDAWSSRFASRSPVEVMAMVAFQFARLYYADAAAREAIADSLSDFEATLDSLLTAPRES